MKFSLKTVGIVYIYIIIIKGTKKQQRGEK